MLNVTKKLMQISSIFIFIITLAACSVESRVDFSELIRRMNRSDDTYGLVTEEAFFSDDEWFLFADVFGDSDILITGREDEGRLLTRVCVSIINNEAQGTKELFVSFCESLVSAFVTEEMAEQVLKESRIYDEKISFSDGAYFSETGRYKTSLYTTALGGTFVIEIVK